MMALASSKGGAKAPLPSFYKNLIGAKYGNINK